MIAARRTPLWVLCCAVLAATANGVDAHVMFAAVPRGERVVRDVDAKDAGVATPIMKSWRVATDVLYRYAKTSLATRLVNPASVAKEISFSAVLPQAAFISAFHIEMDGKVYDAYVKEKEAAKQEYSRARDQGWTAATVVKARDSNVFTVSVNVEAAGKVTFNLTYEELLTRRLGLYHHVINIDPGQVVPEMSLHVRIEDALPLTNLSVPALRMSNEIQATDAVSTDDDSQGPASISRPTPEVAVVTWSPSADEQRELRSEGLRAQLVVQYDVERENNPAQILVGDGYFVHFYAPTSLTPLHKHVVFVLDTSGSMDGDKMPQLKEAMSTVLGDLRSGDAFSIVLFESEVTVWQINGSQQVPRYHNEITLADDVVIPVNEFNVARAKAFVASLDPTGGTNIHDALMTALEVVKVGRRVLRAAKVGDVPEPMVVFLTDGQANTGAFTSSPDIVRLVTAKNKRRTPVYCLAFGRDADLDFLKRLALANAAFARLIYEAGDAALQLRDFYRQLASPLLANVTFKYEPGQVVNSSLTTLHFGTLFDGSELVVAGRLVDRDPVDLVLRDRVRGVVLAKSSTGKTRFGFPIPKVVIYPTPADAPPARTPFMERLWAYLTVQQLLDQERAAGDPKNSTGRTRALELALKYSFVTSLTSLVVVKPNATSASSDPVEAGAHAEPPRYHSAMHYAPPSTGGYSGSGYSGFALMMPGMAGPSGYQAVPASSHQRRPSYGLIAGGMDYEEEEEEPLLDLRGAPPPAPPPPPPPAPPAPPAPLPQRPNFSATSAPTPFAGAGGRVILTLADITWGSDVKNWTHVLVTKPVPGHPGYTSTSVLLVGMGQPDVDNGICPSVGEVTHCRHLAHCVLPEFVNDYNRYVASYFCDINGYAGVCCPSSRSSVAAQGTSLP